MEQQLQSVAVRWKILALTGPALLAAVVGFWSITVPSLWRDESVTVHFARAPLGDAWREWGDYDAVHATYDLLVRLSIWIDPVEFGVRLPSVMGFVAATVGIVLVGRRLSGWLVGGCSATLYVLLPVTSRYAQEGRSYALITAVAVFATLALLRLVERPTWGRTAAYGALVALLGYLHLYGLLLLAAHGMYVVLSGRRVLFRAFVAWSAAAILILPLVLVAAGQRERQLFWLTSPGRAEITKMIELFGGDRPLTVVLGLMAIAGAWFGRKSPLLLLLWAVLPIVISLAISQVHPIFTGRYVMFVVPALALLAGTGVVGVARVLGRGRRGWIAAVVAIMLAMVAVLGLPVQRENRGPSLRSDDLRSLTRQLAASAKPGDVLMPVPSNYLPFVNAYRGPFDHLEPVTVQKIPAEVNRVWVLNRDDPRRERYVELRQLSHDFRLATVQPFGTTNLSLWTRR